MGQASLRDLALNGRRVLVRADFNVPLDDKGAITDDTRIRAAIPTLTYILQQGGSPIVMSHLGRPKGHWEPKASLAPCAARLSKLLNATVVMAPDAVGAEVEALAKRLKSGDILLLENLRFHPGEEHPEKEPDFVSKLARLGECYVNDAFGTAHRAHASTTYLAQQFPGQAAMGFLMEKEVAYLGDVLLQPKRPFVAIIGGAKISSKLGVLTALAQNADTLIIGGGMTFTFLQAQGIPIGDSLIELDLVSKAEQIRRQAKQVLLPHDLVIANSFSNDAVSRIVPAEKGIPNGWMGLDIGPATLQRWTPIIQGASTLFWNGPLGVFEFPHFAKGTFEIAKLVARSDALSVVGGGDSVAAVHQAGVREGIDHISTGGGASLEFIQKGSLPGLDALEEK